MRFETAFLMNTSNIKYGPGVTREIGYDLKRLEATRVMLVADPRLIDQEPVSIVLDSLKAKGIACELFDQVRIEPTDHSFQTAIDFAKQGKFDGYVAIGGGSTIDTAKAANLYATYPAELLTYVNPPIGHGRLIPGKLTPMIAIPTTAGTGSETTGVAIFDLEEMHVKTGIAHPYLRPTMAIVDPLNTRTMPRMVAACTGWDVLCHAIESLTALPFNQRLAPESPAHRPAYQGANPISDIWAAKAIEMVTRNIVHAMDNPQDDDARGQMLLAACFAGIGFGNAGVHLPHGMSYPVSGGARSFYVEGYPSERALIPHGMAVTLNAPAVFRFTAPADSARHLYAAQLMGARTDNADPAQAGELLANVIIDLMKKTDMPNGLQAVGYGPADVDWLVAGTLPQHRVTKLSPRPADAEQLRQLFLDALVYW